MGRKKKNQILPYQTTNKKNKSKKPFSLEKMKNLGKLSKITEQNLLLGKSLASLNFKVLTLPKLHAKQR